MSEEKQKEKDSEGVMEENLLSMAEEKEDTEPSAAEKVLTVQIRRHMEGGLELITLILEDKGPKDIVQYGGSDLIENQNRLKDAKNSDGKRPSGENMRALLTCDGGTLVYDGVLYNIRAPTPPTNTLGPLQQQQSRSGLFTIFVRNHNTSVTNVIKFHDKIFPSTLDEFWEATGLKRTIGSACVTVKMQNGWEKLSNNPKDTHKYVVDDDDPGLGILFQLSPHNTPKSSPIKEEYVGIQTEEESDFPKCIQSLFGENPFNAAIPELYTDEAIVGLRLFFAQGRNESSEVKTLALMFAMPGAGKTRTVQEAARSLGLAYHKYKMSNADLSTTSDVQQFLQQLVAGICKCETNTIPIQRDDVVIHFDEVQSMMIAPNDGKDNSLVTSLAKECDALINEHGENQRFWLKFVMTGTNIFSDTQINVGSQVKTELIPMGGLFFS